MNEDPKPGADTTTELERMAAAIQRCQQALAERSAARRLQPE